MEYDAYILTRQWVETSQGMDLVVWCQSEHGPLQLLIKDQESVMFLPEGDLPGAIETLSRIQGWRYKPVQLKTFAQEPVCALYFLSQHRLYDARRLLEQASIFPLESDLRPTDRYLMERFITGPVRVSGEPHQYSGYIQIINPVLTPATYTPNLTTVSLDIETSFTEEILYSIGVQTDSESRVFMVGQGRSKLDYLKFAIDERAVIVEFLEWLDVTDPDLLIGWSVVNFDLEFLQRRCDVLGIPFRLGRDGQQIVWRKADGSGNRRYALVPGRVVLDGIEMLRAAFYRFESFSLENVSRELLGRGKLIEDTDVRAVEIQQLFNSDKDALAVYNLGDCELVRDIFAHTDLINFALQRAALTGLDIDRSGGSVAAFDYLYLPRLHRKGFVAPRVTLEDAAQGSPGGYVLDSRPGLYENVIVLDFKSLYPSIVRTFHVDPLAMCVAEMEDPAATIPGYRGASFSRQEYLLPSIIEELWSARDTARQENNGAMSQAIKIIMNSFYGVLGTTGCRFYDPRLVSSITMRGHEILQKTRDLIEDKGYSVIYGDTDSVFVWLRDVKDPSSVSSIGRNLVETLNLWWSTYLAQTYSITSCLELEYETNYIKFFMPTVRGSEQGSKKRYAGMVKSPGAEQEYSLVFKGLESVRSDWSQLARRFQQSLYQRIFDDEPYVEFIRGTVEAVENGERDADLVLRKRLRRNLADYKKNVPPHVQAARKADQLRASKGLAPRYRNGGWIEYVMTVNGPEPSQYLTSAIDYDFYIERQLVPVADSILVFHHTSMSQLLDKQLGLF